MPRIRLQSLRLSVTTACNTKPGSGPQGVPAFCHFVKYSARNTSHSKLRRADPPKTSRAEFISGKQQRVEGARFLKGSEQLNCGCTFCPDARRDGPSKIRPETFLAEFCLERGEEVMSAQPVTAAVNINRQKRLFENNTAGMKKGQRHIFHAAHVNNIHLSANSRYFLKLQTLSEKLNRLTFSDCRFRFVYSYFIWASSP